MLTSLAALTTLLVRAAPLLSLGVAAWVVGRFAERLAPRFGLPRTAVAALTPVLVVATVVAGRLAEIAPHWRAIAANPLDLLRITGPDQLSFLGAAAGAVGALLVGGRRSGLPLRRLADLYGAAAPLGFAVYGVGCLVRGDCYGREAPPPLGIVFPGLRAPRYPVELYAAAAALFAYAGVQWIARRRTSPGVVALAAVAALGAIRVLLQPLRIDVEDELLGVESLATLAVTAAALLGLQVTWLLGSRRGEVVDPALTRSPGERVGVLDGGWG